MAVTREQIYSALFERLKTVSGIRTFSRRLKTWDEVSQGQCPALFMTVGDQIPDQHAGLPTKWTLEAECWLYCKSGTDPNATPSIEMNTILDAIEAVLKPSAAGEPQTLGGLVSHCWMSGTIETDGGTIGETAVAIIPVSMLVAWI